MSSSLLTFAPISSRRSMQLRRRNMGSITWGTRTRGMGLVTAQGDTTDFNTVMGPAIVPQPFPGNPDTRPGAWPGLNPAPGAIVASGLPGQVPVVPGQTPTVVVTPTSGAIPPPQTVAAATAAPASWLDQELLAGVPNKWLLLGGIAALFVFGGGKK